MLAFRLAETINLPVMVVLDAFFLSHTFEPIDVPDQDQVDRFLPSPDLRLRLDTTAPNMFNQLVTPAAYMEMRYNTQLTMEAAVQRYDRIEKEFKSIFDRVYGPVEAIHC